MVVEDRVGTNVYLVRPHESNRLRMSTYRTFAHADMMRKLPYVDTAVPQFGPAVSMPHRIPHVVAAASVEGGVRRAEPAEQGVLSGSTPSDELPRTSANPASNGEGEARSLNGVRIGPNTLSDVVDGLLRSDINVIKGGSARDALEPTEGDTYSR